MRRRSTIALTCLAVTSLAASLTFFAAPARANSVPSVDPATTYWVQCRGGMNYDLRADDHSKQGGNTPNKVVLELFGSNAPTKASNTQPVGSCAWHDRPFGAGESANILIIAYSQEQISVSEDIRVCVRDSNCLFSFKARKVGTKLNANLAEAVKFRRAP